MRIIRAPGGGTKPGPGALSRCITGPRKIGPTVPGFMMVWLEFVGGQVVEDEATINRTPFRAIIAGLLADTTLVSAEATAALFVIVIPVTVAEEGGATAGATAGCARGVD